EVHADSGSQPSDMRHEDGREFLVLRDVSVKPDDTLGFTVTGLPVESAGMSIARSGIGLLVAIIFAVAGVYAAWPRKRKGKPEDAPAPTRRDLERRKEQLYSALIALERSHAAGKTVGDRYEAERRKLVAQLALVHRQIDDASAAARSKQDR